jgi:nucleoside-diphosphate-sugar epimerase
MQILITGGSGFLGQCLTDRLLSEGHQIILLGRANPGKQNSDNCSYVEADITNIEALKEVHNTFPDIDTIVHLAALVPKSKNEDQGLPMFETNTKGTINLMEVFGGSLHNFVYASTAEVYGLPTTNEAITEDILPRPLSYYGASKLAGELFCTVYAERNKLPISILRFTVLYGPGDRIERAVPNFIKKALAGESLDIYGGEDLRDYLHVTDAAEALYLAVTKAPSGIFNIGTGKGISILDTADAVIKAINPKVSKNIIAREKPVTDIVLNVDKAKSVMQFKSVHTFPDLIEEQIKWHKLN